MGRNAAAHPLLGRSDKGELTLLVGPDYGLMQQLAAEAGIEVREAGQVQNVHMIKAGLAITKGSLALIASTPEVEGILDRASFGPALSDLAFEADRVIYGGQSGAILVHPRYPGTSLRIQDGELKIRQEIDALDSGGGVISPWASGL